MINLRRLILLILFFMFFVYFLTSMLPSLFSVKTGWNGTNVGNRLYKVNNFLSQIIKRESMLQGNTIYSSQENFTNIFPKYYLTLDSGKMPNYKINKYKLKAYKNKQILHYYENFSMAIIRFEEDCSIVDVVVPKNSSCVVEVDLNTIYEGPNSSKFKIKNPHKADRYLLVIDARNDKFIIPDKYHNLVFKEKD